jgi:hypothetical protein
MCNEREELEKLEEDQLVARKNALNEDYEFTRKKKEEELEPRLQALKATTEDMKVLIFFYCLDFFFFFFFF